MEEFIERLKLLLDYYNLNASSFADKIGVQRSSISHLLSGRNKPSLDFIIKIIDVFPDVDIYWILQGKGTFPKENKTTYSSLDQKNNATENIQQNKLPAMDLFSTIVSDKEKTNTSLHNSSQKDELITQNNDSIHRIVIFYKDGTFEDFKLRI